MESVTAKKKFCCPLHKLYWNREKKRKEKEEAAKQIPPPPPPTQNGAFPFRELPPEEKAQYDLIKEGRKKDSNFPTTIESMKQLLSGNKGEGTKEEKPEENQIPPMPQKSDYEDSFAFAAAKNEWKVKYKQ